VIEQGHFLPGGSRLVDDSGVNETYRGIVEVGANRIPAYVKLLPERQLANELAASLIGRLAGLKLPRAFIVLVRKEDYPQSPAVQLAGSDLIGFATEAVGDGSAARRIRLDSPAAVALFLGSWKEWPAAATFDEWIANADRHPGNVLIGQPGEVWLIDHSHAFTGTNWTASSLNPSARVGNQICDAAGACITLTDKFNAYAAALSAAQTFAGVDVLQALGFSYMSELLEPEEHAALTSFLSARVDSVHDSISARLGLPGLTLGVHA
jgi:hypothetical protein